jgi:hypothetical protein
MLGGFAVFLAFPLPTDYRKSSLVSIPTEMLRIIDGFGGKESQFSLKAWSLGGSP